jgi:hypothetical protein
MAGPLISFLTDFGPESAPAVCRGVMWRIAPEARILDLSHTVRKFAVRDGAFLLSRMVGYLEVGVHVAVVDPGVGTARRPVAVRAERGDVLVGPHGSSVGSPRRTRSPRPTFSWRGSRRPSTAATSSRPSRRISRVVCLWSASGRRSIRPRSST